MSGEEESEGFCMRSGDENAICFLLSCVFFHWFAGLLMLRSFPSRRCFLTCLLACLLAGSLAGWLHYAAQGLHYAAQGLYSSAYWLNSSVRARACETV